MLDHDYNSPSQLTLRYYCPGSVNLQKKLVGSGQAAVSKEAHEGTLKHALITDNRTKNSVALDTLSWDVSWVLTEVNQIVLASAPIDGVIVVDEYQIDLSDLGISGGKEGCRVDLSVVIPGQKAIIVDYKFGVGYVPRPKYNWQMKAYAVGVYRAFGVTEIEVIILQPNVSDEFQIKEDFFYGSEIEGFETEIKNIVDRTKDENAPLVRGDHCIYYFCKARDICPLFRNAWLELPQHTTVAAHLKNIPSIERQKLYENVLAAESWCKKARATIESIALSGEVDIEGYEIGTGRKTRDWNKPEEEIQSALTILADQTGKVHRAVDFYTIKSPSEIEVMFGKSKLVKSIIDPLIIYKDGKPCLKKKGVV
jgi:hypothetical protein